MLNDLILFDSTKPSPDWLTILIYASIIIIATQLIFITLTKVMGIDTSKELKSEKDKEYIEWEKKKISPWSVLITELIGSSIYSPVAEEIIFRILLMKFICTKQLGINPRISNIIQGIVFGGMHMSNTIFSNQSVSYTKLQILNATIAGIVSGWTYYHTNSILPSLIAHCINNTSAGLSEVIGYTDYLNNHKKDLNN